MRDNINVNSSLKLFESYRDFSGGLNTQQSNEMVRDNQALIAENVDLALTHSIKKRSGRTVLSGTVGWTATAPIQGLFKFVNNAETVLIAAVEGKLWFARPSGTTYGNWTQISITDAGSPFTFQTTDCVEAVQYGEWLYVATGTKLVRAKVYLSSGTPTYTAETVVDQYKPTSQEALFIGLNALNTTPTAFLVDQTTGGAGTIEALGVYMQNPRPVVNENAPITAFVKTQNPAPSVDYQWSYRKSGTTTWTVASGWTTTTTKTYNFNLPEPGVYDILAEVRLSATHSTTDSYPFAGIEFFALPQEEILPAVNIQKCRKILLHWDRLFLYDPKPNTTDGLTNERDQLFISHVGEPSYFPMNNTISFAADVQQSIRKIVQYRNILLIFTPDTVQSLAGKKPSDYVRSLINSRVGALWANSVQVVENDVYFVSKQGIYAIRPNTYTQDNFNIAGLDLLIQDQFASDFIVPDSVADVASANNQVVSAVFDNQYYLYSTNGKIYRHYYDRKTWVTDNMSHLGSIKFSVPVIASFNGDQTLIEPIIRTNSAFYALDNTVYTDAGLAYTMKLQTKYFDLSQAFNFKKLRRLYVLMKHFDTATNLYVTIQADAQITLTPDVTQTVQVTDPVSFAVTWEVVTTSSPNIIDPSAMLLATGILGTASLGSYPVSSYKTNIRAKARRVNIKFVHTDGVPCEIYGFGFEFRSKRP